ncbi:hypothetical protein H6P81_007508 [Aristolochia fimbriata]|uniref:DUF4371 domain-containing protein n=1 Tax=Aristolochia fimbriata TaxID=158543 RepID=A0AAV7F141_ARIFI|nr:hypothetical protein H6P81_007508 [Aristolochia fimbriata]
MCVRGMRWELLFYIQSRRPKDFQELAIEAHNMENLMEERGEETSSSADPRKKVKAAATAPKDTKEKAKPSFATDALEPIKVGNKGLYKSGVFYLVHVRDTSALTLKTDISKVLSNHNLNVKDIRGQGYDGASNMRGEWNGLQALFLQECPYAYYVHCLAHRLQLALVAASREVIPIHQFFSNLTFIINVVGASCKKHDELQAYHAAEIAQLVAAQELESGRGLNQMTTLKRAGDTRWGSHLSSISSLIRMFNSRMRKNEISIPDMSSNYAGSRGRSRRQKDPLTVEHHYRIEVFLAGLDSQLQELNTRFSDHTMDLLILSAALDPQDRYKSFNINNICELVDKFYPDDFTEQEKYHLKYELQHYELDVPYHVDLQEVKTIGELCQKLVETGKATIYPLFDRLLRLLLTLPVSTATTEELFLQ